MQDPVNKSALSRQRLEEVAALAVAEGLFVFLKQGPTDEPWRYVTVQTPAGHVFALSGGGWNKEGMLSASVGSAEVGALKVHVSDVRSSGTESISASASSSRSAGTILKDFKRRVFENPDALAQAQAVKDRLAQMVAQRGRLLAHVATLEAQGYEFRRLGDSQHYMAEGYSVAQVSEPRAVKVYENGRMTFEADCDVSHFEAVRKALTPA